MQDGDHCRSETPKNRNAREGRGAVTSNPCPETGYRMPPDRVAELLDTPPVPDALPSSDGLRLALLYRRPFTTIRELARPEVRLAGLRLDVARRAQSRRPVGYRIGRVSLEGGREAEVTGLPGDARIDHLMSLYLPLLLQ